MTTHYSHKKHKKPPLGVFLAATVMLFFCTLSAADSIGFVPDYIDGTTPVATSAATPITSADQTGPASTGVIALSNLPDLGLTTPTPAPAIATPSTIVPVHISIPAGNINLPVQNPTTTDVNVLDNLLKAGPAHYINSADLGEAGNLIIFAHSSHLPVVINKMYQAFNNIPHLTKGDTITITGSDGKDYLYSVVSVVKADVNSGTTIDISPAQGTNLTLVTCDTLTGVSARFVLSATFIGVSN